MPKITDAGMNNAGVIDGLRLPQLVSMLSLMSLDYAGGTPTLRPNTLLFNHLKNNSDAFDFGDGQGVQKGITMFDLDESIKRVNVGAFFPGHQMTQDLLATPAQWPIPRYEGDLLLVRAGAVQSGTPIITAKDAVYAWSPAGVAAASGAPYADVAGGNTGAWVDATPELVAKGLLNVANFEAKPCKDAIEEGATPPTIYVADATVDTYVAGRWYKASDGKIRKALLNTNVAPTATANANYLAAWGSSASHYTQAEFDALTGSVYCSFFDALKYLADLGGVPRGEFGEYPEDTFLSGIVTALGDIRSDASIESYTNGGGTMPTVYPEAGANDNYINGQYYQSDSDGKIYQRIGPTGAVDPDATGNPIYATLWGPGVTAQAFADTYAVVNKLRINVKHDASLSGQGNEASLLKVQADQIDFSVVPRCMP